MSWQALSWAIKKGKDYELEPTTRHVMLTLANYADPEGNDIYPSLGTLHADTGLSEATLRRHIKHLIRVGLMEYGDQAVVAANPKIRPDKRPKCYRFIFERPGQPRGVDFGNFGTDPDERGITVRPRTVSGGSLSNGAGCQAGYHSDTQTINQTKKPSSAPAAVLTAAESAPEAAPAAELTEAQIEAGRVLREQIAARNAMRRAHVQRQPTTESE